MALYVITMRDPVEVADNAELDLESKVYTSGDTARRVAKAAAADGKDRYVCALDPVALFRGRMAQ